MDIWKLVATGTYRAAPELAGYTLVMAVPEDRANEIKSLLRRHGATTVDDMTTFYEHPHRDQVMEP